MLQSKVRIYLSAFMHLLKPDQKLRGYPGYIWIASPRSSLSLKLVIIHLLSMLTLPFSIFCCALCSSLFVALLYIWPLLGVHYDVLDPKTRDRTDVIKMRSISVICAAILSYTVVLFTTGSPAEALSLIGITGPLKSLYSAAIGLLLTLTLMAGPLYYGGCALRGFTKWQTLRALVIAPITEEFVFRGCCDALLQQTTLSYGYRLLLCGPVFFTLAHVHHFANAIIADPVRGVISACLTMSYTGVFGAFCTALLESTGSLAGPIVSHAVCNYAGLPDFNFNSSTKALAYGIGVFLFIAECVYLFLLHY
ncbi:CAAX prenyl protease [Perkinsus chesapeaki]|uniref:intramembrane prenyl-peptidase Rce1 n=1 Tax=Perkinsus chesapeaki TaxID=330153 RepID=A0A7J6M252_PERCH|nr:CAAX prenyl protease [Perkinsus chesapeaki]